MKKWVQDYIDDNEKEDYKERNENNWGAMSSKYWASWKFP